jgi:hypothetical protein
MHDLRRHRKSVPAASAISFATHAQILIPTEYFLSFPQPGFCFVKIIDPTHSPVHIRRGDNAAPYAPPTYYRQCAMTTLPCIVQAKIRINPQKQKYFL